MQVSYNLTGILKYDPKRGEDFRKEHKQRTLIVQRPFDDFDLYYQWFHRKKFGEKFWLQRPMFGTHITVVGGNENVPFIEKWKQYEGQKVSFSVLPGLHKVHHFWYVKVLSSQLMQIRQELGLKVNKDFHITIGRLQDWN